MKKISINLSQKPDYIYFRFKGERSKGYAHRAWEQMVDESKKDNCKNMVIDLRELT